MNPGALDEDRLAAISELVRSSGVALEAVGPQSWKLIEDCTQSRLVSMNIRGPWLHFESVLRSPRGGRLPGSRCAHQLLLTNTSLPGCLNYCVGLRTPRVMLSADVPVDRDHVDDEELPSWVTAACVAFRSELARGRACTAATSALLEGWHDPLSVDHELGEATRTHCENTGWTHIERGNGQLAITLEVPDQFCQAHAYQVGEHGFRLGTALEVPDELPASSRRALELFLLTACRLVRLARVGAVSHTGATHYRWEVAWPCFPSSTQFDCGLAALSIACRLTVRELQALCDESIASTYLDLRGCTAQ